MALADNLAGKKVGLRENKREYPGLYRYLEDAGAEVIWVASRARAISMVRDGALDLYQVAQTNFLAFDWRITPTGDLSYTPAPGVDGRVYFQLSPDGKCAHKIDDINQAIEAWLADDNGAARFDKIVSDLVSTFETSPFGTAQ